MFDLETSIAGQIQFVVSGKDAAGNDKAYDSNVIELAYVAPTPEPTATPAPSASGYRVVVESDNGLNLRAQPNAGSEVLYVLPYGMVLTVLGEGENGFLYVQWGGYTGYVSGDYVTPFGAQ